MKSIIAIVISILFTTTGIACAGARSSLDPELASPEATVMAYCRNGIFNLELKYFHFSKERASTSGTTKLNWKDCDVVGTKKLNFIGEVFDGTKVEVGDVQVILTVEVKDRDGNQYSQTYSFFLHKYLDGWKIFSYSAMGAD